MTAPALDLTERLRRLRDDFDRGFAEPPRRHVTAHHDLIGLRAGDRHYALRLPDTAGLFVDRAVTPLPGPLPALLGVAGFRGVVVPVYELAAVLGHAGGQARRWLVLAAGEPLIALAFDSLDGHLRVPAELVVPEPDGQGRRGCLDGMVLLPDGPRSVVDVPAVRAAIHTMTGRTRPSGEI